VEATNDPAVQSLTWTSPPPADIFCWEKYEPIRRQILKIFRSETRISAGVGKFADQVTVIFDAHLPRYTPLFMRCREGVRVMFYSCAFLRLFIGRYQRATVTGPAVRR
jgi:hypothetical protein